MRNRMKNRTALPFAMLALALLSILASAIGRYSYSTLAVLAAGPIMLLYRRTERNPGATRAEAVQFISNMAGNSKYQKSVMAVLKRSLDPKFAFYHDFNNAMEMYRYSGSTGGMYAVAKEYRAEGLTEAVQIISDSLNNGSSIHQPMAELMRSIRETEKRRFSAAKMQGLDSVVRIGAVFFFPVFAGISIEITRITSALNGATGLNALAFSAMLMFYISYVNNSVVKNSNRRGRALHMAALSAVQIAVALLLFRFSSFLGSVLLR